MSTWDDVWSNAEKQCAEKIPDALRLTVPAPPCPDCAHWRPLIKLRDKGEFDGIRLCHAEEMFRDFTCFSLRKS